MFVHNTPVSVFKGAKTMACCGQSDNGYNQYAKQGEPRIPVKVTNYPEGENWIRVVGSVSNVSYGWIHKAKHFCLFEKDWDANLFTKVEDKTCVA